MPELQEWVVTSHLKLVEVLGFAKRMWEVWFLVVPRLGRATGLPTLSPAFAWKPPSAEFLTSRLPTLKAAHLTILVDFHKKFFGPPHPTRAKYTYTNAFLCRMFKMINVLDPYLARKEEDLRGTPFENAKYALADERFDCLKDYCEMATKDKKVTAKICF
eukprot:gene25070-28340_t